MKTNIQQGKNKAPMSTSTAKATPVKAPAKKAAKVGAKAVVAKAKTLPKISVKAAPLARKAKTVAPLVKKTGETAARKSTPTARKRSPAAQPGLKLVAAAPATKTSIKASPKLAAPKPVQDKLRLFQIYYRPEQRQLLDPAFEPYNNEGDNSPLLEFNVFRKLMNSELVQGAELWGALSWKFKEKTGLSGTQLRGVIEKNPGHDVYYCNPFPELEGLYHNLWLQGETSHPNFLILCRDFFKAAGLDVNALEELQPSSHFAASNYFVATPAFWQRYLAFIDSTVATAEKNMSDTAKAMVYSSAADKRGLHAGASYLPFIVERLFGYFLARHTHGLKVYKYSLLSNQPTENVHLKLLGQMKDAAVKSKSLWLATCWINYRNLYFSQVFGADWCKRYLAKISPLVVNFK
ncbi:MAG: hypothetical protein Q8R72_15870 [Hylemonella sp.]|nr:hypothetical protein [Hylemonella sp.]